VELRQLRTFLAVAEHGGFRRAAVKLHFSQPALTAHIRELERSLGVRLFERHPSGIQLTPEGRRFLESAQRMIDLSDAATLSARDERISGPLRIGVFPASAAELTRPLLVELRRLWPAVDLDVVPLRLSAWAPAVEGVDALIMRDPVDAERVRATELFREHVLVAIPWHWPSREATRLTLNEFLDLPLVRPADCLPSALRAFWCLEHLRDGDFEFRGYGAACAEDVADDIACGLGAAVTTGSLLRSFGETRFGAIPFEHSPDTRAWVTTRIEDRRPIIEALHRQVVEITARIGSLILPELTRDGRSDPLWAI
jgi:DNA-binding transcriptional LysR family regulator